MLLGIWHLVPIPANSKDRSTLQPTEINFLTGTVLAVFLIASLSNAFIL